MKKNYSLKVFGAAAIMALLTTQAGAQTVPGAAVDVAKGSNTVKVIDNKGTIKYFQSNNGITQITNTTNDRTTTTWQLGGTLTEKTYIDVAGKAFALDGLALVASAASTDATDLAGHGGTESGYTILVRDETTGALQKMLATSLIDGGVYEEVLATDAASSSPFMTTVITGLTTVANRISVFRNGMKLRQSGATPDWGLSAGAIAFTAAAGDFYATDVIEVQWVK